MKFTFFNIARLKSVARRWRALLWLYADAVWIYIKSWFAQHWGHVGVALLFVSLSVSIYFVSALQKVLEMYLGPDAEFAVFKMVLMAVGSALVGAAAIAFSFIMFAMQVNVERMPHGLFKKFSADFPLFGSFATTFFVALTITAFALIPNATWLATATLVTIFGVLLILTLFLGAYRRALWLINPTSQIGFLVKYASRDLHAWARRADRGAILLSDINKNAPKLESGFEFDYSRHAYFQRVPRWTAKPRTAIRHAISYARRYAEQGDHDVANIALDAIVRINEKYVQAKEKTFFPQNPFISTGLLTEDAFINDTLEHLRQNVRIGVSRGDEQQIEQTFHALEALCRIYLEIDYVAKDSSKLHANLAADYLAGAVQSAVPHNMADVLMKGLECIGRAGQYMAAKGQAIDLVAISERVRDISLSGVAKKEYLPATQIGIEQFVAITLALIYSKSLDISFTAKQIRKDVSMITKLFISRPNPAPIFEETNTIAAYYADFGPRSLLGLFDQLVGVLNVAVNEDDRAKTTIWHVRQWAQDISQDVREIFLLAIEKRSLFTSILIVWITQIAKTLEKISCANACDNRAQHDLVDSAISLIHVFSFIPDNKESIDFAELCQIDDQLFHASMELYNQQCNKTADAASDTLLWWAFKVGKHEYGRHALARACYGLATLDLMQEKNSALIDAFLGRIEERKEISRETCENTAKKIHEKIEALHRDRYPAFGIEGAMAQADPKKLRALLKKIATTLSLQAFEGE